MANLLSFGFKRKLTQDSEETPKEAQPKKKSRPNGAHRSTGFDEHWLKKYTWLCHEKCEDGDFGMWCKLCRHHRQLPKSRDSTWVLTPSRTYRADVLARHDKSKTHAVAADLERKRLEASKDGGIEQGFQKQLTLAGEAFMSNLRILYWLIKKEIPHTTNFADLIEMAKELGCTYLDNVKVGDFSYTSERTVQEMVLCLGEVIEEQQLAAVRQSDYWSILLDETTDVSVNKQLILYAKYLDSTGESKCTFLGTIEISNGKADTIVKAISDFCEAKDLQLTKLAGIGSDGANVMIGCKNGVAVQLQEKFSPIAVGNHCLAHREALAAKQAAEDIKAINKFNTTLLHIYNYYEYSAVRSAGLKAMQTTFEKTQLKPKQPKAVRWLSHDAACSTMKVIFPCVLAHLDQEAAAHNEPQAVGLHRMTENWEFVAVLNLMLDTLPQLSSLSKFFQKSALDFCGVKEQVQATVDVLDARLAVPGQHSRGLKADLELLNSEGFSFKYTEEQLEKFKTQVHDKYLSALCKHLKRRFPSTDLLDSFLLFTPRTAGHMKDLDAQDIEEVQTLLDQYGPELDEDQFKEEVPRVLHLVAKQDWSLEQSLRQLATVYKEAYPQTAKVAQLGLLIPMSTADCERGFSALKRIKTQQRNRLSQKVLNSLMMLSTQGPASVDYPYKEAAARWTALKNRRIEFEL